MEKIIVTIMIGAIGGLIGVKLKIPAGAMIGSMLFVAVYNIYTAKGYIPPNFKILAQILVGGIIGLNFTMDTIKGLKELILPALLLSFGLIIAGLTLGIVIHKITGLDINTALFSSSPGGLTDMTLISDSFGADSPKVAILQLARLIMVLSVMPTAIKLISSWFNI